MSSNGTFAKRVDWVDYAKGICIVMVVMMHSVLGAWSWLPAKPASCMQ